MLSLSMIVRDEAGQIEDCLKSAQGFVDEMVVVDTGSKDNTVALAEAAGARVEQIEWPGDFAPARNQALAMVQGDWVLVLDADERLKPEAWKPLRALMAQPDVLVINLLRHERGAIQSPYSNVSRLFRRHPRIQWSRAYHSMIDDSVEALIQAEPQWRIVDCGIPALIHDGYRPELLAGTDKAERLRQAMEQWLEQKPGDPYACAKLGALEVSSGNRERGVALLEQGLASIDSNQERHAERYELLLHLASDAADSRQPCAEPIQRCDRPRCPAGTRQRALELWSSTGESAGGEQPGCGRSLWRSLPRQSSRLRFRTGIAGD